MVDSNIVSNANTIVSSTGCFVDDIGKVSGYLIGQKACELGLVLSSPNTWPILIKSNII